MDDKQLSELTSNIELLNKSITSLLHSTDSTDSQVDNAVINNKIRLRLNNGNSVEVQMSFSEFCNSIYNDTEKLKRDTSAYGAFALETDKKLRNSLDEYSTNFKIIQKSISELNDKMEAINDKIPKTFTQWLSDKAQTTNSISTLFRGLLYIIVFLWAVSTGVPKILESFNITQSTESTKLIELEQKMDNILNLQTK